MTRKAMTRKRGRGRPPLEDARSVTKRLRLTAVEAAEQESLACREGLTWSDWARRAFRREMARG
jgi:hypothetical protein